MFKFMLGTAFVMSAVVYSSSVHATRPMPAAKVASPARVSHSIGFLDVNRILTESKAAKALNSQMEIYRKTYQEEIQKQEQGLKEKETVLVAEQKNFSPNEFEKKRKEFEKQVADLQKHVMAKDTSLKEAGQTAMEEIRKAVIDITKKIAHERNFKIIFPAAIPVYISDIEKVDITNDVIEKLDVKLPKINVVVKGKQKQD